MHSRIGSSREAQAVRTRGIPLGAEVKGVSVERRVVTEIEVWVRISGVIEFHGRVRACLSYTLGVHDDRRRRKIVAGGITELNLDWIGAAALLDHVGIVERANLKADLMALGRERGRVNIVVAKAPVVGSPHHANIAVVEHADVVEVLLHLRRHPGFD